MLGLLGATTLVLVAGAPWVLPGAADGENLKPPQNVEVYIIDDNVTLKWDRSESVHNVSFSAEYQQEETKEESFNLASSEKNKNDLETDRSSEMDNWLKLPGCQHIMGTKCDFVLPEIHVFENIKVRVRAVKGNSTSPWTQVDPFVPYDKAHIGPPGVHVEAEDETIQVFLSLPGKGGTMWITDNYSFTYYIELWSNSSGVEKRIKTDYLTKRIYGLLPETTYCLKVKAEMPRIRKFGTYSPVVCVNTTGKSKVPVPENVEVDARGNNYVLKWSCASAGLTFKAQWLDAYSKWISGKWKPVPACENVRTTHCVFPQNSVSKGRYLLRVQASDGNNTSFWSEEIRVDPEKYTTILPPVIALNPASNSLQVYISDRNSQRGKFSRLTYEVVFWRNTSNKKTKLHRKTAEFPIDDLEPLTLYCIKAKALMSFKWNKSSNFSDIVCEKTKPGNSLATWIVTGIAAVLFFILVVLIVKNVKKCLSYIFFPSLKPPSSINEYFCDLPVKNLLLLTSEEQTERCFIIENTDTVVIKDDNPLNEDPRKYSSQSSQDSGNYSNEDEASEENLAQ